MQINHKEEKSVFIKHFCTPLICLEHPTSRRSSMVRIKVSQKIFTEDEVVSLTGICTDHLRKLAQNKHLGTIARAAEAARAEAEKWLFSHSDLLILTVLQPRCDH